MKNDYEVTLIIRDINGRREIIKCHWNEVANFVDHLGNPDDYEILLVYAYGVCIYSSLAHGEIDWDDIVGYFA